MTRSDALAAYEKLPLPDTTEEHWRFTDLRGFDPDSFAGRRVRGDRDDARPRRRRLRDRHRRRHRHREGARGDHLRAAPGGPRAALLARRLGREVRRAQRGALEERPPRRRAEGRRAREAALRQISATGQTFWRLVVVAEEGARASIIEEYASPSPDTEAYSNAVTELFVEPAAKLEYVSLQNLSRETWHFANHHARVERDAELDWVAGGFGSKKGKTRIQNDLNGRGATSRVTGAYFADGTQHLDYDTFQEHIAPDCECDFAFKGALRDEATAVWRGMIRVEKDAQKTNAYQECRNLMLSPTTHAVPIPGLEILANDVRCTHAATVGRVDREDMFYLMSRGLTRQEAERLIVRGFFQEVLDRIELEPVRDAVTAALEARIPQA